MRFFRRHWYNVGMVVAVITVIVMVVFWRDLSVLQRLILANFVALLVHQYEEYGWPAGGPAIVNMVLRHKPGTPPDRYPLNQNSAMAGNVLFAVGFYLVPVFFPNVVWLGLGPVVMGFMQFVGHGIWTNIKLRSIYNPGLVAVVLGHIPIGAYYVYYVQAHGLASGWDWVIGVAYMLAWQYIALQMMTYKWLANTNSPYPFTEEEMHRFDMPAKMDRLRQPKTNAAASEQV